MPLPVKINHQFFLVEIDKEAQRKKRTQVQSSERAYLGLTGMNVEQENHQSGTYPKGIRVLQAEPGSPAEAAGFKDGDRVVGIDGQRIDTIERLIDYIWKKKAGDKIVIELYNAISIIDRISTKEVILSSKPPSEKSIQLADNFTDMQYNLQYGVIHDIGKLARKEFPMAEVGDLALFNHKVEYKPFTDGDRNYNDWHLVHTLQSGNELRVVDYSYEIYGVIKLKSNDFHIYPYKNVVFCHQNFADAEMMMKNGIYIPTTWEKTAEEMQDKLEELQLQITELSKTTILSARTDESNFRRKEEIFKAMHKIQQERGRITKEMHKKRLKDLTVLFINPETCNTLGSPINVGDTIVANYHTLYPLDFAGACYTLAFPSHIEAHIPKETNF